MIIFIPICVISKKIKHKWTVHNAHHTPPHSSLLSGLSTCLWNVPHTTGGELSRQYLISTIKIAFIDAIFDVEKFARTTLATFRSHVSFIDEDPGLNQVRQHLDTLWRKYLYVFIIFKKINFNKYLKLVFSP